MQIVLRPSFLPAWLCPNGGSYCNNQVDLRKGNLFQHSMMEEGPAPYHHNHITKHYKKALDTLSDCPGQGLIQSTLP